MLISVVAIILVALVFDFLNGFHDAANSVATVVSTGTLSPNTAVAWAAFFNFVAAFGFGVKVATTGEATVADVRFRFETASKDASSNPTTYQFQDQLSESATAERPVISLWASSMSSLRQSRR